MRLSKFNTDYTKKISFIYVFNSRYRIALSILSDLHFRIMTHFACQIDIAINKY